MRSLVLSILVTWRHSVERVLAGEFLLLVKGTLCRMYLTGELLLTRFLPITLLFFGANAGLFVYWSFAQIYPSIYLPSWMPYIQWGYLLLWSSLSGIILVLSRSSSTRKDWRYLLMSRQGVVVIFYVFIALFLFKIQSINFLFDVLWGFNPVLLWLSRDIVPREIRIYQLLCYHYGLLSLWAYYMSDEGALSLQSLPHSLLLAFKNWIYNYPLWVCVSLLGISADILIALLVSLLTTIIPKYYPWPVGVFNFMVGSMLSLLVQVWYAAAVAVYYESIRFYEEG